MVEPKSQIAVTLYGLRDFCRTRDELDMTVAKVKSIGYQAVQISGIGPISPEEVRSILEKHDMYCCATHENLNAYENQFDAVVAKMKLWDCPFTALGYPGDDFWRPDGALELAQRLQAIGDMFHKKGITFGYHNHHHEFVRYGGVTFLDEIYQRTDDVLFAELDTHWIQRGGGDSISWIRKMKGRLSVIHLKDFAIKNDDKLPAVPEYAEIGEGNLPWPEILKAGEECGVRWYVVEQDEPRMGRDIFDSIRISFENLRNFGLN